MQNLLNDRGMPAAVAACLCMLSAGCQSSGSDGAAPQASGNDRARQVVEATERLCAFAPTVTSILAILSVPAAPAADKLSEAICAEVEKLTSAGFTTPGQTLRLTVDGKPVTGTLK